jgi:hypothetical protein
VEDAFIAGKRQEANGYRTSNTPLPPIADCAMSDVLLSLIASLGRLAAVKAAVGLFRVMDVPSTRSIKTIHIDRRIYCSLFFSLSSSSSLSLYSRE